MNIKPTPSAFDEDLEATAELPVVDFAPAAEDASAASTDVFPIPAIPVGTTELAERLREVEQRLHRKSERVRQQELLLNQVGERQAMLEAQLAESRVRQAELQRQLEEARAHAQVQSQHSIEIKAAASQHHAREFSELRSRSERLLEALSSWQGFRSMSDALLAEAEARNALLESQVVTLGEALRTLEGEHARAAQLAAAEQHGGNDAFRAELAALKSEVGALQSELLGVRERQQQSAQKAEAEATRARNLEAGIQASVVMFGNGAKNPQQPGAGGTGAFEQLQASPADAPRVLIRQDGANERVYPVGRRTTIGRTPDNSIQIDVHNISRHHAVLLTGADHCIIEDLNSTNGVLVNGRRVIRQVLQDGDIVMVGKTEFRYRHRT